jgi:tetratricopeptide (TPR) repeat protein
MRGAIDWSYGLLSAAQQRLFERLSIFAGGCSFETAAAVCADDETRADELFDVLSSLIEKSLVVVDNRGALTRYYLLEPFRQYAREKLKARGEHEVMARRQALSLLKVAERLWAEWDSAAEPGWRDAVQTELVDWRGVLEWSLGRRSDIPTGQRLVGRLQQLTGCNPAAEWQRWIALARDLAGPDTPAETLAALSYAQCVLHGHLDQQELELASAVDSLARYRTLDDERRIVVSEYHVARALFSLGRHSEGEPVAHDAIARARRLGLLKTLAVVLLELARSHRERGNFSLARRYIAEARTIYVSVGATFSAATVLEQLALCDLYEGKPESAAQQLSEAASICRAVDDWRGLAVLLTLCAQCLRCAGDFEQADACAREALATAAEYQHAVGIAGAIQRLVAIALFRMAGKSETRNEVCERSARLFGFVDAVLVANGSPRFPHDTEEYEAALKLMYDGIGKGETERLVRDGATMTEEQAVEEALQL